jgi:maltooligosyltrehalose trehalohydrolase
MYDMTCSENPAPETATSTRVYSHGAFPQPNGTTRFSLWAPDASKVEVQLADGNLHALEHQDEGWYSATLECAPGIGYRYIINGNLKVPDPAARLQHGDANGLSCVVNHSYPWQTNSWQGLPWHQTILYELHVGLIGGFSKVEKLLPSLAQLGITAIELMPINEFPGTRNWGYDGVLPFAPEASYGTPDELKHLIDTAHGLGIMVFLDVVYNHFGPDGNYLGQYASGFFRDDIHTPWGSAIDFRKREVRDFFCENALMWIMDYRFDGLRLDAVHAISEKDFLVELATRVRNAVPPGRYVHLVLENEDNTASLLQKGFNAQWNDDGHNVLHYLLTNEDAGYYADFAQDSTAKLARCLHEGFIYQGEPTHTGRNRGEPSAHLPPTAFVFFLQNHDQVGNRAFGERLTQLSDPAALKATIVLLMLSPMIPLLFMGEERGVKNPFLYFTDHNEELAKAVRDGRRAEFAAFENLDGGSPRQQINDPNAISSFLASKIELPTEVECQITEEQISDHKRWWFFYKQLIDIRQREIIPRLPGAHSTGVTVIAERVLRAEWKLGDGSYLNIYLNLSTSRATASPSWKSYQLLFNQGVSEHDYQRGILSPYSALATRHS